MSKTTDGPTQFAALLSGIIALALWCAYWFSWQEVLRDDAFIYYRYVQNLLSGQGFVFNPGERVNACTSALYPLLVAVLAYPFSLTDPETIPFIGHTLSLLSLGLTILIVRKMLLESKSELIRGAAPFFPLILLAYPRLRSGVGMESFLTMAMAMYTLYYYKKGALRTASVFAALAILSRPDCALLLCVLGAHYVIQKRRLPPMEPVVIFFAMLIPWFLFSYLYYGSWLPNTFGAKLEQGAAKELTRGFAFLQHLPNALSISRGTLGFEILLWMFGGFLIKRAAQETAELSLILLWTALYILAYAFVLNAPGYPWYYVPTLFAPAILISITCSCLFSGWSSYTGRIAAFLGLVLVSVIVFRASELSLKNYTRTSEKFRRYSTIGTWLSKRAKQGEALGSQEIGILGYSYKKGPIVDGLGLIHPRRLVRSADQSTNPYLEYYKPAYVLVRKPPRNPGENFSKSPSFLSQYTLYKGKLPANGYQLFFHNSSAIAGN